jgi:hypothetical protein
MSNQFVMPVDLDKATWDKLDPFVQGYLEGAFFTINESLAAYTFSDLAPEALQIAIAECNVFMKAAKKVGIEKLFNNPNLNYDEKRAGTDFWLTRNRHGAGFWDRGLGVTGNELTKIAQSFGETDLYDGDDGLLYLS